MQSQRMWNGLSHAASFALNAIDLAMSWNDPTNVLRQSVKFFKVFLTLGHGVMAAANGLAFTMTAQTLRELRRQLEEVRGIKANLESVRLKIDQIKEWIVEHYDNFDENDQVPISRQEIQRFDTATSTSTAVAASSR